MEPRNLRYEDLVEGSEEEWAYRIDEAVYKAFVAASGDRSPIHVDDTYARARGFAGCVMHGGILHGFLSHFVGMVLPGARSLLLTSELRFARPVYLGDSLTLQARIAQKLDAQQVVVLHVVFRNETRSEAAASGRAQVLVRSS